MESALRKPSEKYNLLKFGYGKPIPSFRGIRADVLYTSDYKANERTIKQIASNRDLPEEVVRQAID